MSATATNHDRLVPREFAKTQDGVRGTRGGQPTELAASPSQQDKRPPQAGHPTDAGYLLKSYPHPGSARGAPTSSQRPAASVVAASRSSSASSSGLLAPPQAAPAQPAQSAASTSSSQTLAGPIRQRMSLASDQLGFSLRQLYASASNLGDAVHPPAYQNIPGTVPYYHGRTVGPPPSYDDVVNPYAPPPTYQSLFGQMREARKSSRSLLDLLRRLFIIVLSTLGCTLLIAFMILIPFTMILVGAVYIDECHIEHIPAFLLVGGLVWASKNLLHCYGQCKQQQQQRQRQQLALDEHSLAGDLFAGSSAGSGASAGPGLGLADSTSPASLHDELDAARRHQRTDSGSATTAAAAATAGNQRLKSSICESLLNCVLFGWFIAGCVIIFRNYEPDFENAASARYCHRTVYMYTFWLISSALLLFGLFVSCICCLMVSSVVANRQEAADLA